MKAMVLERPRTPLRHPELPTPSPRAGEVLVKVATCGVCRTDLHVVDGDLKHPKLPIIPGHEIVGHVCGLGPGVTQFKFGDRVGIPRLGYTCGTCGYCRTGMRTFAMLRASPATNSTEATLNTPLPTSGTASRFRARSPTLRWHPGSVPA
jgi:D-arabinose 1-dehydrogenase-like Zn-dependent alcohol dehydrogenase